MLIIRLIIIFSLFYCSSAPEKEPTVKPISKVEPLDPVLVEKKPPVVSASNGTYQLLPSFVSGDSLTVNGKILKSGEFIQKNDIVKAVNSRIMMNISGLKDTTLEIFETQNCEFFYKEREDGIHIFLQQGDIEVITGSDNSNKVFIHTEELVIFSEKKTQVRVNRLRQKVSSTEVNVYKSRVNLRFALPNKLEFADDICRQNKGLEEKEMILESKGKSLAAGASLLFSGKQLESVLQKIGQKQLLQESCDQPLGEIYD